MPVKTREYTPGGVVELVAIVAIDAEELQPTVAGLDVNVAVAAVGSPATASCTVWVAPLTMHKSSWNCVELPAAIATDVG